MADKISFKRLEDCTVCEFNRENKIGFGVAHLHEGDTNSKLMGETVAYYKAIRDFAKSRIRELKEKIKYMEHMQIYLFPPKFHGRQIEWIKLRFDKELNRLKEELITWEKEAQDINSSLTEYFRKREKNLKVIEAYKKRKSK